MTLRTFQVGQPQELKFTLAILIKDMRIDYLQNCYFICTDMYIWKILNPKQMAQDATG